MNDVINIWEVFHKELRTFIYAKTRNPADTDDILQDVFFKIIQNVDKINQAGNIRQYIFGMVKNAVSDYFRNLKKPIKTDDFQEPLTEDEIHSLNTAIADRCIRPFIDKLPEGYREALLITEFQNISQKELAERLNISYSGAKSRVQRGKEKLKELILGCCSYQSDSYGNIMEAEEKDNCSCP